jgi:hypothetical protein
MDGILGISTTTNQTGLYLCPDFAIATGRDTGRKVGKSKSTAKQQKSEKVAKLRIRIPEIALRKSQRHTL